jgi:hypothetical protein
LQHFASLSQLGSVPETAPHNSDARQPQDTTKWPPSIIVDLSYAAAALKAWSSHPFIEYAQGQTRDAYYGNSDDSNLMEASGSEPSCVDAQIVQSGSGRYNLVCSRNKASNIPPKGRHISDMMDVVSALWMRSSRVNKIKLEDAQASRLACSNEGIKAWIQSQDGPTTI